MQRELRTAQDVETWVQEIGFLPFFKNDVAGWSVEEHCPPGLWFVKEVEGPWEWKGPIARRGSCVYGKLFNGKAGFVRRDWLPDLANYRRNGYDFDARYEDGMAAYADKVIYEAIQQQGSLLSTQIKSLCGYDKEGAKGFDARITRLQMQTYVTVADFDYKTDRYGRPYGWGVARYTTPEAQYGEDEVTAAYGRSPEESWQRLWEFVRPQWPHATDRQLQRLLG